MNIANKIKQVRDFWDLKQQDVADICGVTASAVSQWENSVSIPRLQHLRALADYLNISINTLVTDDMRVEELERIEQLYISMNDEGRQTALTVMEGLSKAYPRKDQ